MVKTTKRHHIYNASSRYNRTCQNYTISGGKRDKPKADYVAVSYYIKSEQREEQRLHDDQLQRRTQWKDKRDEQNVRGCLRGKLQFRKEAKIREERGHCSTNRDRQQGGKRTI